MTIDENTRLDLRRAFEELIGPELANAAMEAMPPLDYNQLATRTDVENSALMLRSEMAELRADMKGDFAKMEYRMSANLRTTVLTQFATMAAFAGFVVGLG